MEIGVAKMRVIMTCGGTGGHIYPAIAIANKIKEEHPNCKIVFIGTGRPLEKKIITAAGYELRAISASGVHRKKIYKNVGTARDLLKGMIQAEKIIKDFNPRAVIGTGGYVCVPVITKAHKMGSKTYIQEQNARPGMANRWLASKADKIFLGFEEASVFFKNKKKVYVTGNPIRKSFGVISKTEARKQLFVKNNKFVILIFGGSLGASMINKATVEAMVYLTNQADISIYFITGNNYYESVLEELDEKGVLSNQSIKILKYAHNMDVLLSAADLVVSRAGALTLGEEALIGTPAILIPSPNVTGNHQYYNAKAVADRGGAVILQEADLSGPRLVEEIMALKLDLERLNEMGKKIQELGSAKGVDLIYNHLGFNKEWIKGNITNEK